MADAPRLRHRTDPPHLCRGQIRCGCPPPSKAGPATDPLGNNNERKFAMATKELPAHPSLEQYKKQAKDLLKSSKSGHREALQLALQRIKKDHPRFGRLADLELRGTKLALADAQLVIAREHGFGSWPRFAIHIEGLTRQNSPVSRFESAVYPVVT